MEQGPAACDRATRRRFQEHAVSPQSFKEARRAERHASVRPETEAAGRNHPMSARESCGRPVAYQSHAGSAAMRPSWMAGSPGPRFKGDPDESPCGRGCPEGLTTFGVRRRALTARLEAPRRKLCSHPYDDPDVIAGGRDTLAIEVIEDCSGDIEGS